MVSDSAFVDPTATVHKLAQVWHFSVILAYASIGTGANIGSRCEIGKCSVIGNRSRIGSGTFLPPGSWVADDVFIGPNVTFTDDRRPRVDNPGYHAEPPTICHHASIGAGAIILPGVKIGMNAMVGAGAIVTRDVPDGALVRCEPARIRDVIPEGQWE
jgi:acetyltransferase-like isoleucine patch superfamily enzyme